MSGVNFPSSSPHSSNGKIVYLAGPSSMGKSTYSKKLVSQGWLHVERDEKFIVKVIGGLKAAKEFTASLQVIKDCLNPYPSNTQLFAIIHSDIKPDKEPKDLKAFIKAQNHLRTYLCKNDKKIIRELDIEVLEEAQRIAQKGQSVIIDDVSLLEEYYSIKLKTDGQQDVYHFKGKSISIEERVKYLPISQIMQNIMRRNQNPLDSRDPLMVLDQFGDFFKTTSPNSKESPLDTIKVDELKTWIARAVTIRFVDILSEPPYFFHEGIEGIDQAIEKKISDKFNQLHQNEQLIARYENSNSPLEKAELCSQVKDKFGYSKEITEKDLHKLLNKEKQKIIDGLTRWVTLTDEIETTTQSIFKKMKIPRNTKSVNISFYSKKGARPFIINGV